MSILNEIISGMLLPNENNNAQYWSESDEYQQGYGKMIGSIKVGTDKVPH